MEGFEYKGRWAKDFFKNENPLILELGCGKGEYTVHLGRKYPEKNFIGLDIKGARMWRGARTANDECLKNVAFLRTQIQLIEYYFDKNEVSEIWIVFPDPQPRSPRARKRLTSPEFIDRYKNILKPDGIIHLKTDNEMLFDYTIKRIREHGYNLIYKNEDLYNSGLQEDVVMVRTFYEQMWLEEGRKICYLKFQLS